MDEVLAKINTLTEQIDKRFEAMDKRLSDLEKGQAAIREDIKNSDDIFQLFELKTDHDFKKVMATQSDLVAAQSDLKAELASLRTHLFLEEGSREHADTVSWDTQDKKWRALDKRLHVVEAHLGLG